MWDKCHFFGGSSGFFTQNTKTLQRPIICPKAAAPLSWCQEEAVLFVKFAGSYDAREGAQKRGRKHSWLVGWRDTFS